ncbi:MAG: hypothetical protein E6Q97_31700, partial [Desulfurellales bacterium]
MAKKQRKTEVLPARPRIIGGPGTRIFAGFLDDLDRNPEVRGDRWYGNGYKAGISQWMLTDAHVRASTYAVRDPVTGATWDFEPGADDDDAQEAADLQRMLWFERLPWSQVLRKGMRYIEDGFALLETTTDVVSIPTSRFKRHPGNGYGIGITGVYDRPAWTVYDWQQNPANPEQLLSFRQNILGSDTEEPGLSDYIPARRCLRFSWEQDGANFVGRPILRSAYGPFKAKIMLQLVEMIRHEREHNGLPTFSLPEGAPDSLEAEARKIASSIRANEKGFLVLPDGIKFEWSTTKGTTDIHPAIERQNRDIAFNVCGAWMLTGTSANAGGGSYAHSSNQRILYDVSLDKHADFIEDVFNIGSDGHSIISELHLANYGP